MAKISVLGTGHMGAALARRLLSRGHQVTVWNRTEARAAELTAVGARAAPSPAAAVDNAEIVITMLTDAAAVDNVLFGPAGAAGALRPDACLVEMSTIGPAAVRDLARRVPRGVQFIDAPVGGSVAAAEAGTLTLLAGGDTEALDRVTPVLQALGTVRRCGGLGAGAALKLVLNTALITSIAALADALSVADAVEVDRKIALAALSAGPLAGAVTRATAKGASFAISLAGKDLDLALHALDHRPAPVARATAQALRHAPDPSADLATLAEGTTAP